MPTCRLSTTCPSRSTSGGRAQVAPAFSTRIIESVSGHEQRSTQWADARLSFDAGPGVRSEADIAALIAFFRARRGAARGFRFRDPFDDVSGDFGSAPVPDDQPLGLGDGSTSAFALIKTYGAGADAQLRFITRPVEDSIRVALDGIEQESGWRHVGLGVIGFDEAPGEGVLVSAGFRFDVPVRFAEDRLEIDRETFAAGLVPSVPLVEIRGMSDAAILAQALCAFAFCWRLERRDGVTIGLTSHDRALRVDGLDYAPAPGITPSAILRGGDPRAELTEVAGALSSAALSEADLDAGRWDGARAMLHLTEWTAPGTLWLELARGTLGSVAKSGHGYSVALKGLGALLGEAAAPATSPTCRARLGDMDCTVDLRTRQMVAPLIEVAGERVRFEGLARGSTASGACAG